MLMKIRSVCCGIDLTSSPDYTKSVSMPKLVILQGGQAKSHEIANQEIIIGRLPECDLQLESNMVSRQHAKVWRDNEGIHLEDLGSGNGTFLNGKKLDQPAILADGDRLKFGPILVRFEAGGKIPPKTEMSGTIVSDAGFALDIGEENDASSITGKAENASGFGMLDVQPEVKLKSIIEISRALA